MTLPVEIDHFTTGVDYLPTQYNERPNIEAFLKTWLSKSQEVETDLSDILYKTFFLKAEGANLDRYGSLFGLRRVTGSDDKDYRERVVREILRRASDGSPDRIREILEATLGFEGTRIYEHINTATYTGGIMVFGYSPTTSPAINIDGNEGLLVKLASPVTTGSAILGLHTKRVLSNNELFIPTELQAAIEPLYLNDDDFLVNQVDDKIAIRNTNTKLYGLGWEQGLLAEIGTLTDTLEVETDTTIEPLQVEVTPSNEEGLQVERDGIANDKGVFLEIAQHNLGDKY